MSKPDIQNDQNEEIEEDDGENEEVMEEKQAPNKAPVEKLPVKTCGKNDVIAVPYSTISTGDRLTVHRGGYTDLLNSLIKRPKGSIPETYLPQWPNTPMDKNLPEIPAPTGAFLWSRGLLCKSLVRNLKEFYTDDPHNRRKVVTGPYNALHDPTTENYFKTPIILELIYKQGFITEEEQVVCSFRDFNQYRRYLCQSKYAEDLAGSQTQRGKILEHNKNQFKEIQKHLNKTEGKQFKADQRRLKAAEQQVAAQKMREKKFKQKKEQDEFQEMMYKQQLEEDKARRKFEGILKDNRTNAKICALKQHRLQEKVYLVNRILQKDKQSAQYIEATRKIKEATKQEYLMVWLEHKWKAQEEKIKREKVIDQSIRQELLKKADKRQAKVEKYRAQLPQILEKRKAEEKRIWGLVRKYFYRWLENVRKRKARRPDAMHKSLWDIPVEFDETVKYLRKESGYEKFDDFILSIVKLKQNIREELEKEEAAEREAAAQLNTQPPSKPSMA